MNRRKVIKAVSGPLVVALGTAAVTDRAENPHVEPMQHEEEPRLTYDTPFTTTSGVVVNFSFLDPSLLGTQFSVVRSQIKK
jgi:hypothetical protein